MKSSVFSLAFGLLFATSAFGESEFLNGVASLPSLKNVSVRVVNGPALAEVEPTTWLEFSYESCSRMKFSGASEIENNVVLVKVRLVPSAECHGPTTSRQYSVQIGSMRSEATLPVVVLNPVARAAVRQPPTRPVMCTAIAGQVYHPETGECRSFTNGCQLNALRAEGYTMSVPDGACGR